MQYDVVIIGGGAAGSVLAGRLAAHPHISVLVLEAGPDYPDPATLPDDISSATPALPKPKTRNTTGPCGAPSPRSKGRFTSPRVR